MFFLLPPGHCSVLSPPLGGPTQVVRGKVSVSQMYTAHTVMTVSDVNESELHHTVMTVSDSDDSE